MDRRRFLKRAAIGVGLAGAALSSRQRRSEARQLALDSVDRHWGWDGAIRNSESTDSTCITPGLNFGAAAFENTWKRTDQPVLDGLASRTWMWGQQPYTCAFYESYLVLPGGERLVQYYDKSRMEITNPDADSSGIWPCDERPACRRVDQRPDARSGDSTASENWRTSAQAHVAGDRQPDTDGPTYASLLPMPWMSRPTPRASVLIGVAGNVRPRSPSEPWYLSVGPDQLL